MAKSFRARRGSTADDDVQAYRNRFKRFSPKVSPCEGVYGRRRGQPGTTNYTETAHLSGLVEIDCPMLTGTPLATDSCPGDDMGLCKRIGFRHVHGVEKKLCKHLIDLYPQ